MLVQLRKRRVVYAILNHIYTLWIRDGNVEKEQLGIEKNETKAKKSSKSVYKQYTIVFFDKSDQGGHDVYDVCRNPNDI